MDEILNEVKGGIEEKIEGMTEGLTKSMPEEIIDGAEGMINEATGMNLDLNGNEAPTESSESSEPAVAAE